MLLIIRTCYSLPVLSYIKKYIYIVIVTITSMLTLDMVVKGIAKQKRNAIQNTRNGRRERTHIVQDESAQEEIMHCASACVCCVVGWVVGVGPKETGALNH